MLNGIVRACLSKDPSKRPTAAHLAELFNSYCPPPYLASHSISDSRQLCIQMETQGAGTDWNSQGPTFNSMHAQLLAATLNNDRGNR